MQNFAIDSLMPIDSPRVDGDSSAPLMRRDFHVPGLMEMQTPRADEVSATRLLLSIDGLVLSYDGLDLTYSEPSCG